MSPKVVYMLRQYCLLRNDIFISELLTRQLSSSSSSHFRLKYFNPLRNYYEFKFNSMV